MYCKNTSVLLSRSRSAKKDYFPYKAHERILDLACHTTCERNHIKALIEIY